MFKPSYLKSGSFEDFLDSETGKKKKETALACVALFFFYLFSFFTSQSLNTGVTLKTTEGKTKTIKTGRETYKVL